ncbi:MAG TPA: hypothetical protein VHM26_10445 [Chitinophagaceae bacterium]|nr:hypothetical protein [Chitinophagaceae bacterium]
MAAATSPKYIVVGIDGTSSAEWRKPDGSNSHVFRFVHDFHYGAMGIDKLFLDGPSDVVMGRATEPILQRALDFVTHRIYTLFPEVRSRNMRPLDMFDVNSCKQAQYYQQHSYGMEGYYIPPSEIRVPLKVDAQMLANQPLSTDQLRVIIVGHSRGGLAATVLARMLSPLVRVYFLGLYDSVDRQPCLDGSTIENVKIVYHARRHPETGSRGSFSNTSTRHTGTEHYVESFFYTSHGGVGGYFVSNARDVGMFGDFSCTARPDTRVVPTGRGGTMVVDNRHALTKKFNRPIEQICASGRDDANLFIRNGARKFGLPIN